MLFSLVKLIQNNISIVTIVQPCTIPIHKQIIDVIIKNTLFLHLIQIINGGDNDRRGGGKKKVKKKTKTKKQGREAILFRHFLCLKLLGANGEKKNKKKLNKKCFSLFDDYRKTFCSWFSVFDKKLSKEIWENEQYCSD